MEVCNPEVQIFTDRQDKTDSALVQDKVSSLDGLIEQLHKAFETDYVDIDHVQGIMAAYRNNPQDWKKYAKFDRYRCKVAAFGTQGLRVYADQHAAGDALLIAKCRRIRSDRSLILASTVSGKMKTMFHLRTRIPILVRRYTRNLVDEGNGRFNLMVLCWGEGHGSAIHDHADAHCVMKILQGELCETRYAWPSESTETSRENEGTDEEREKIREIGRSTIGLNEICYINDSMGLHRVENPSTINPAVSLHLYSPPFKTCSVFNKQTGQRLPCKVTFWSKYGERRDRKIQDAREPEDN